MPASPRPRSGAWSPGPTGLSASGWPHRRRPEVGWPRLPGPLAVVACVEEDGVDWAGTIAKVARGGRTAWAEVASRRSAFAAAAAGARGLILAGHEAGGWRRTIRRSSCSRRSLGRVEVPVWVRGGIGPQVGRRLRRGGGPRGRPRRRPPAGPRVAPAGRVRTAWPAGTGAKPVSSAGRRPPLPGPRPRVGRARRLRRLRTPAVRPGREADGGSAGARVRPGRSGRIRPRRRRWPAGTSRSGGIVQAVERRSTEPRTAPRPRPAGRGSALARSHGTRYPILQGPMTRVSDVVPFAAAVAEGGALPFLALAMLRGPEAARSWPRPAGRWPGDPGAWACSGSSRPSCGASRSPPCSRPGPPFALIAGGRPDQARELERTGIATYLHVPSPGLLDQFLSDGARRFVLEGRECGGHVGPRSSFVLWEQAIDGCRRRSTAAASRPSSTSSSPAASTTAGPPRWSRRWPRPWRPGG